MDAIAVGRKRSMVRGIWRLVVALVCCAPLRVVSAAPPVHLWYVSSEDALARAPSRDQIATFLDTFGAVLDEPDTVAALVATPERARLLLAQTNILAAFATAQRELGVGLRVHLVYWDSALEDLRRMAAAAGGPDLIYMPSTWTAKFAEAGLLRPLGASVADLEKDLADAGRAHLLDSCKILGQPGLYAVPWHVDARVFYWHRDAWPHDQPPDFHTFPGFLEACAHVVRQTTGSTTWYETAWCVSEARDWNDLHNFAAFVHSYGGSVVDVPHKTVLEGAAVQQTLALLATNRAYTSRLLGDQRRLERYWMNRQSAILLAGPRVLRDVREQIGPEWPNAVGLALLPSASGREADSHTFLGGANLAISKFCRHPDAERVLRHLAAGAGMRDLVTHAGLLPAFKQPFERYFRPIYPSCADTFETAIRGGVAYPSLPRWADMESVGQQAFSQLWGTLLRGEPVVPALAEARGVLATALWPPSPQERWMWGLGGFSMALLLAAVLVRIWARHRVRQLETRIRFLEEQCVLMEELDERRRADAPTESRLDVTDADRPS